MSDSFQDWLLSQIDTHLGRPSCPPPFILWCDARSEWLELLRLASHAGGFELWAEPGDHELTVRHRFATCPRVPRVVWRPVSATDVSWFSVFALEADYVWQKTLIEALREYGVVIARDDESELLPLLPAHAREWFGRPRETWRDLTPGHAKAELVTDERVLEALAGSAGQFERLRAEDRFSIFAHRAIEEFGLPDPSGRSEEAWRVAATATLLCTEAAAACPQAAPPHADRVVPAGPARDRALALLKAWQANVYFIPEFERLAPMADRTMDLAAWARGLEAPPRSLGSRAVEEYLLRATAERLARVEDVDRLAGELDTTSSVVSARVSGFWEARATSPVGWRHLERLAAFASLLVEQRGVAGTWRTARQAVEWYGTRGWHLDAVGESLFEERTDFPPSLSPVRDRLRRGYLQAVDTLGQAFSELLARDDGDVWTLPTVGELAADHLGAAKGATALFVLDALRYEVGQRLAAMLNAGEPARRAEVQVAIAPVPTVTSLGMAFALPANRSLLSVDADGATGLHVAAEQFDGDLTVAENRRRWLRTVIGVREFLSVSDVLDGDKLKAAGRGRRVVVVEGTEFDDAGHEGRLQRAGTREDLERYARAIRKLREAGFSRIVVVTDHGFFHWQPASHEIDDVKPQGEVLWMCRRAAVGRHLTHATAVPIPVLRSRLEARVPRSVNTFRTYGGLGYFHGGALLQEMVIPCVTVQWPAKATKVAVVLKPVGQITSLVPRIQVEPGVGAETLFGATDRALGRRVLVKVQAPDSGRIVFRAGDAVTVEPGGPAQTVQLARVDSDARLLSGTALRVVVIDADNEELLASEDVALKVDVDEW